MAWVVDVEVYHQGRSTRERVHVIAPDAMKARRITLASLAKVFGGWDGWYVVIHGVA